MKRRTTLSITLVLSLLLLSLVNPDATAKAQQGERRFSFDTGVLTLNNPDQVLRLTVDWGDGETSAVVRFRRKGYFEQGNIYKVASEVTTAPITLASGEAAHIDISQDEFNAVRGEVLVRGSNAGAASARVTVQIITRSTG